MPEFIQTLLHLLTDLGSLLLQILQFLLSWSLVIAWVAWWLWGVNWRKAWPVLARGAWAPAVLALVLIALVWSQVAPGECNCLGVITVSNFWWQLGYAGMLAAVALFCGWLQGVFAWTPAEISLEPPAAHHHGNGHGHH